MSKPTLIYWKGRGRAEAIRMCLAMAGVEWQDAPYITTKADITKYRQDGILAFDQLSCLQWDGTNMVQVGAIVRHIGRKYGLDGRTEQEKFKVDMLWEGASDFFSSFVMFGFIPADDFLKGVKKALPRYMNAFEKVLIDSKSGYLVGDSASIADIRLFEVLLNLEESHSEGFKGFPKIKEFFEKMKAVPQMRNYLNGPRRFPPNDEAYVNTVKATLFS